jgi:3-oxoacyl-[acyl-carrier protein] reductase
MPSNEKSLVVISGAARGIGRACVEAFLASGWGVAALDNDAHKLSTFAAEKNVIPIVTDVTDPASVEAAMNQLTRPALALVNVAGIFPLSSLATADVATYRRIFDVNVLGTVLLSQAIARTMPLGGTIVNFASINAFMAKPDQLLYNASKAAVVSLTRGMAADLAERRIRVNAVAPGPVDTEGLRAIPGRLEKLSAQIPLGRIASPSEMAALALWLVEGEGAQLMTGETVVSSGGTLMR